MYFHVIHSETPNTQHVTKYMKLDPRNVNLELLYNTSIRSLGIWDWGLTFGYSNTKYPKP